MRGKAPEINCAVAQAATVFLQPRQPQSREAHTAQDASPQRSTLVSGLRSEHSNPSRSTLAGSGLNRPSVAPEIQFAPGRSTSLSPSRRATRLRASAFEGPGDAFRRRGAASADFGIRRRDRARTRALVGPAARARGQEVFTRVRRPSVHFAARVHGVRSSAPLRNSIQTTLVLSWPIPLQFFPLLCSSRAIDVQSFSYRHDSSVVII
ncbi:hypothetical protein GY45DRAFT_702396 [Cubamyces sp. BRFM 1775]|nr:hypothetical protein GY45DRAFT_702396 [Cubamyces sp. BRFM 1775]